MKYGNLCQSPEKKILETFVLRSHLRCVKPALGISVQVERLPHTGDTLHEKDLKELKFDNKKVGA